MHCPPGCLIQHLDKTPGFTLQHLRFLVLDEADRLVSQRYQNWIERVHSASLVGSQRINIPHVGRLGKKQHDDDGLRDGMMVNPVMWRRDGRHADDDNVCHVEEEGDYDDLMRVKLDSTVCHSV